MEEKSSLYIVAIVGVVAVVALVILVIGAGREQIVYTGTTSGAVVSTDAAGAAVGGIRYNYTSCYDTDGGIMPYIQGQACRGNYCEADSCFGNNSLDEKYCSGIAINSVNINCPCSNGVCLRPISNSTKILPSPKGLLIR